MKKEQRKQAYATYTVLEYNDLDPTTHIVNPSQEAIIQAKEWVDENQK